MSVKINSCLVVQMRYNEIQPTYPLAQFVECFWTLEKGSSLETDPPDRILPDGCVELVLNFGERFLEHKDTGSAVCQPVNFMVGQMTRPMLISPIGRVELLGIRFHPAGTLPFFRFPVHDLTNKVVELGALSGGLERDFIDGLYDLPSMLLRISALKKFLLQRMNECEHNFWLLGLTRKIVQRGGLISVDQLAQEAGVSSRQLERCFRAEVGIGPKLFCRILRFQQVFRAVDSQKVGWAAVANACGYYDQAHLIRDFQQFACQTPASLVAHPNALTESFTRKNRMSDFSNSKRHSRA